jgi:rhodanese-related sulfurtransferase
LFPRFIAIVMRWSAVMRNRLLSSLILATLSLTGGVATAADGKTPVLSRAQFEALLSTPQDLLILDVRQPDEVTRIGGFPVYLSAQLADLEENLAWVPKDRQIVVISNHAVRAIRAGDLLTAKGYNVAGSLGVQTYEEEGGKVLHIAPRLPRSAVQGTAKAAGGAR